MVEIADIKDNDSLKEWLEDRSKEECIQIATRAALRVLPLFWEWSLTEPAQKHRITALPVLRCLVISRLAGKGIDETQADANVAAGAVADPSVVYEEIAHLAAIAAYTSARITLYAVDTAKQAATAVIVAARAAGKDANIIGLTKSDCKALIDSETWLKGLPLWHELENPLQSIWQAVKTGASEQPEIWAYWVKWYEDILAGKTPNWPLEQKIALIEDEVWKAGPEAAAEAIKEIQLDLAVGSTRNAERIVEDPQTHKLKLEAVSDLGQGTAADIQAKMTDAADTFAGQGGDNGPYAALMPEIELLLKVARLSNPRPMQLYDTCRRAERRTHKRVSIGECPDRDPLIEDFLEQLQEAAFDVAGANDDVRETVALRAQMKMREEPSDASGLLTVAADKIAELSEGDLAEELPEDARIATDENQPEEARRTALYKVASRTLRVYRGARQALSEVHDVSKDVAGLSKNVGIIVSSSVAIQAAVNYLLSLL